MFLACLRGPKPKIQMLKLCMSLQAAVSAARGVEEGSKHQPVLQDLQLSLVGSRFGLRPHG